MLGRHYINMVKNLSSRVSKICIWTQQCYLTSDPRQINWFFWTLASPPVNEINNRAWFLEILFGYTEIMYIKYFAGAWHIMSNLKKKKKSKLAKGLIFPLFKNGIIPLNISKMETSVARLSDLHYIKSWNAKGISPRGICSHSWLPNFWAWTVFIIKTSHYYLPNFHSEASCGWWSMVVMEGANWILPVLSIIPFLKFKTTRSIWAKTLANSVERKPWWHQVIRLQKFIKGRVWFYHCIQILAADN